LLQRTKSLPHAGKIIFAGRRQLQLVVAPHKQRDAEELLELFDVVAHRGGRQAQFLGCLGETQMLRCKLEHAQGIEGQRTLHCGLIQKNSTDTP
jgi:hypothetical protein